MQDNIGIVIAMILIVVLIIIFPIYNLFERQDDMAYTLALKATTNFVDKVKNTGYIDQETYDDFVLELASTGNAYNIEIEAHRKTLVEDTTNTGEYLVEYKIDYNDDIFESLTDSNLTSTSLLQNGAYLLNEEDQIYVKVENLNQTSAQVVFNAIIPTVTSSRIEVSYGGIVTNTSWEKIDSTVYSFSIIPKKPTVYKDGIKITTDSCDVEVGQTVVFTATSTPADWFKSIESFTWKVYYEDGSYVEYEKGIELVGELYYSNEFILVMESDIEKIEVYATDNYNEKSLVSSVSFNFIVYDMENITLTGNPDISDTLVSPINGEREIELTVNVEISNFSIKTVDTIEFQIINNGIIKSQSIVSAENITTNISTKVYSASYDYTFASGYWQIRAIAKDSQGNTTEINKVIIVNTDYGSSDIVGGSTYLETPELYEGTKITGYSFTVIMKDTHNSSNTDVWKVWGITADGDEELIASGTFSKSIYIEDSQSGVYRKDVYVGQETYSGTVVNDSSIIIPSDKEYVKLKFYYYTTHTWCIVQNSSNINYKLQLGTIE